MIQLCSPTEHLVSFFIVYFIFLYDINIIMNILNFLSWIIYVFICIYLLFSFFIVRLVLCINFWKCETYTKYYFFSDLIFQLFVQLFYLCELFLSVRFFRNITWTAWFILYWPTGRN